MDGVVLCHELKSNPEAPARYVILLTGEAEQRDKVMGLDLSARTTTSPKPFQPPEFAGAHPRGQAHRRPC